MATKNQRMRADFKTMKHLFVYGSLLYDEVLNKLLSNQYQKIQAELAGYKCVRLKKEVYPVLVPCELSSTTGLLLIDVKPDDLQTLDEFEGDYYFRSTANVTAQEENYQAEVYLFKTEYGNLLADELWDASEFRERVLGEFLGW